MNTIMLKPPAYLVTYVSLYSTFMRYGQRIVCLLGTCFLFLLQSCNDDTVGKAVSSDGTGRADQRDMLANVLVYSIYIDRGIAARAHAQGASAEVVSLIVAQIQLNLVRLVYLNDKDQFSSNVDGIVARLVATLQKDADSLPFFLDTHWTPDEPGGSNLTATEPILPAVYPVGAKFAELMRKQTK